MLGVGATFRALRGVARLYRFWRIGVAATGVLAAAPVLPFFAPFALWLALAVLILAAFPGPAVRLLRRLRPYRRFQASMLRSRGYAAAESVFFAPRKQALLARLASLGDDPHVVDLGAGAGATLRYLPPNVKRVTAVEPNAELHAALRAAGEAAGVDVRCVAARAEALPLRDGSVDAVLAAHVLCSVDNPRKALREAARVLRPGGLFIFLEHEAAHPGADAKPPGRGAVRFLSAKMQQRLFAGPWRIMTGGCHLTRQTGDDVAALSQQGPKSADAPFERLEMERFSLPEDAACFPFIWLMAPHAAGAAVRRGGAAGDAGAAAEAAEAARQRRAEQAQPEGRPREKRLLEARAAVERRSEIEEVHEEEAPPPKSKGKGETSSASGFSLGEMAKSAVEVAAVTGAVAAAAATVTAASTPALMRRVYRAAGGRD